jgi:hypothetical protein
MGSGVYKIRNGSVYFTQGEEVAYDSSTREAA